MREKLAGVGPTDSIHVSYQATYGAYRVAFLHHDRVRETAPAICR
jgi:hypothetical protein